MMRGSRLRQLGWAFALGTFMVAFVILTLHVNTVKSEVRLAERQIIALEREKVLLETEFQTRANQQQLADWNRIEFGYQAPEAGQYLENERQLASLGMPRAEGAPDPIRVAQAPVEGEEGLPTLLSPVTGQPAQAAEYEEPSDAEDDAAARSAMSATRSLADRLSDGRRITAPLAEVAE